MVNHPYYLIKVTTKSSPSFSFQTFTNTPLAKHSKKVLIGLVSCFLTWMAQTQDEMVYLSLGFSLPLSRPKQAEMMKKGSKMVIIRQDNLVLVKALDGQQVSLPISTHFFVSFPCQFGQNFRPKPAGNEGIFCSNINELIW